MYVCICNAVTERTIHDHVARGVNSLDELTQATGLGACCGSCRPLALEIIDQAQQQRFVPVAA